VRRLLKEQFEAELPEDIRFYMGGKSRVYAYKSCEFDEIASHRGIYFGTIERDGLRLSIEGSFIAGKLAKKNVIELDEESFGRWMRGEDIEADVKGYCIVKHGSYFAGCGKGNGRVLRNFVPKDRRVID
jgi:NOL1/NOP2/fmu family ribosome biogenesis protein